jgi:predicted MFS family arabinose efflux permease
LSCVVFNALLFCFLLFSDKIYLYQNIKESFLMKSTLSSSKAVAWSVWIIVSIFYAYQYVLRVMPNIMIDDIMTRFHISSAAFGQFSGVYYIGYSLMHLPIGIMLDRYGPKKIMTASIVLIVLGMMPLLFADHWLYPIIGRVLIGMGSSTAILGVFKVVRMTFTEARFTRMLTLSVTIGLLGAIYGGGPVSYMLETLGYERVIELFSLGGLLLAGITYWLVPDIQSPPESQVLSDIKSVLSNSKVLLSCCFAGLMVGPMEGFADVWGSAFLRQAYGFDVTTAASLPSMIYIGMCFGGPLLSLLAERISYLPTIGFAGAVMTAAFAFILVAPLSSMALSISFLLIGICSSYQILAIYKTSTYVSENQAGLTTAIANMIIMIFGYAFHTAIGMTVDAFGGQMAASALEYGVAVIPIALCLGTAGYALLFAKERLEKAAINGTA